MTEEHQLKLTLHPQSVISPILRTIRDSLEVMKVCVAAVQESDFSKATEDADDQITGEPGDRVTISFDDKADDRTPDEKRAAYLNWLLPKGLQEYARSVRSALERAYVFNALVEFAGGRDPIAWGEFQETLGQIRKRALGMKFPQ